MTRPHPFALLFPESVAVQFAVIHARLGPVRDQATFALVPPAMALLRELRPDQAMGSEADQFIALVHAAYLFWLDGECTVELGVQATRELLAGASPPRPDGAMGTRYIQVSPRLIWGQLDPDGPFEPLDGWFEAREGGQLRMVACFGVHAERPGMSMAVASGPRPDVGLRSDGSAPFAPTMPGGDVAGLAAIDTMDELLLLGWRVASPEEIT